jgi:hypothetical protein
VTTPSRVADLPGTRPGGSPPPGFTPLASESTPAYSVARWRAARPVRMTGGQLSAFAADRRPEGVVAAG